MWNEEDRLRAPVNDFPPLWASAWGDDAYGLWADLQVGAVTQRLRWVEPGAFLMGSTAQERSQISDKQVREWSEKNGEAPQHPVTLSQGYWLADTPCTQALWKAVMGGDNPSRFKEGPEAPDRPVEQVSWDTVQTFIDRLKTLLPAGCQPHLPTEAQWEYACRAGTQSAYWWGEQPDHGKANMEQRNKSTTPVKRYEPNPWGLYDMHGNVWEWCADARREYKNQAETDPENRDDKAPLRVLRGGSWGYSAGLARAAFRYHSLRGYDWSHYGFRLALRSKPQTGRPEGGAAGRR